MKVQMRFSAIAAGAALSLALAFACNKALKVCTPTSVSEDESAMEAYIRANNLTVTQHSTGMYYQIIEKGSGPAPTSDSKVCTKYVGRLTNGQVFDSSDSLTFPLSHVIPGWQVGIPLINEGGSIKLIIPPSLAYGCEPQKQGNTTVIPANAVLVFDVKLLRVE